jgi:hypothetical protein
MVEAWQQEKSASEKIDKISPLGHCWHGLSG